MAPVLTVWEGDYGVASIDINSLILITYVKFAKMQCTIKYSRNPILYDMPQLSIEEENITKEYVGFHDIWEYFQLQIFNIDHFMSVEQASDSYVYFNYINKSLLPGILVTLWVESQNYIEVTRKWYKNAIIFPFNCWYLNKMTKQLTEYVKVQTPEENLEEYSNMLIDEAKKCIHDLSIKLGNNNYFFGSNPSSFDAIVFGYLAPLLNVPIPISHLQVCLKEHENLLKLIKRITNLYFVQQKVEYKYVDKMNEEEDTQDFKTPPRTLAIAAFCATTAMVVYGMINGIIKVPSSPS